MTVDYTPYARIARYSMWSGYIALLLVTTFTTLITPTCERETNVVIWLLHWVPLLAFLPALIRERVRACAWLCFVLIIYFLTAVPVAFACTSVVSVAEVVVVTLLFVSTMMYIRWQSRWKKQQAPAQGEA